MLLRLMFGHWVRQCGRWHRRNHLSLILNSLPNAGHHSVNQNYTLLLFTTFYESVLNPLHLVLIRSTCSKYVVINYFSLHNCEFESPFSFLQHPFVHNACGRPVIIHLLSQCMTIEQLLQQGADKSP